VKHGFRNTSPDPVVLLITTASKLGRFFQEIGKPITREQKSGPPSTDELQQFLKAGNATATGWRVPKRMPQLVFRFFSVPLIKLHNSKITLDYGSASPFRDFVSPGSLLSCIGLRSGQVKLLNFQAKLSNLRQCADAIPLHRPKQHAVCLHHFDRPISRAVSLSEFHFARLFKAATGDSPYQFVTRMRMERAKELLRKTRLPISQIAERVGFTKPNHFSARFRSVLGCPPDFYRKSVAC
jgi:AraC-like DNA-binding protein